MSTQETNIIEQCQKGDLSKFGHLYDNYINQIYKYVYYRTHHRETAEDLTSTAFTKALEKIKSFSPRKGTFQSWLYRIAKNTIIDHYKKLKSPANIEDVWDISTGENIERDVDTRLKLEKVSEALKELKPAQREIIILRVWDGLSYKEIGEVLGKTEPACKVAFSRAIAEIRENDTLITLLLIPLILN